MNQTLQQALCRDFPVLCQGYGGDPRQTCMAFGFECGDGWEPLIRRCLEKIEALRTLEPDAHQFALSQVKEKYGTLRIYLGCGTDAMFDAAVEAERASEQTCEGCGTTQDVTTNDRGWISTLCVSCRDKPQ